MKKINQQAEKLMNVANIQQANFYISETNSDATKSKHDISNDDALFANYIKKAIDYFSMKKTLLYAEQPRSFYDLYVCNNLSHYKSQISDLQINKYNKHNKYDKFKEVISDATLESLEKESKYVIIAGTGGIGKSMFLTHILLSLAKEYASVKKLPILVSLKDYKEEIKDVLDFIWKAFEAFAPKFSKEDIINELENKRVVLMLDGLDELQSALREKFNTDLENFIKAYPDNNILMASRPASSLGSFISFTKFSVFNVEPLTKEQAITLIKKLSYWNQEAKENFIKELDKHLYQDHEDFAGNPLLLTIMLLAYTDFGDVPAKIHVFYSKAYETMARDHDATKGSFKRPFYTKLTPEELKKIFGIFCVITYDEEKLEFSDNEFISYMDIALQEAGDIADGVTSQEFLQDLTDNLCIMYKEGGKYHFIHKSFQEYFTAYHIAHCYDDEQLIKVGDFFENKNKDMSFTFTDSDKTFDMLYDMIPERVERHIFLPYLKKLLSDCEKLGELEGYWEFLERQYGTLIYNEGITGESFKTKAKSFLYKVIVNMKHLQSNQKLDVLSWPAQIKEFNYENWIMSYASLDDPHLFDIEKTGHGEVEVHGDTAVVFFHDYFEHQNLYTSGRTYFVGIREIRENPLKFIEIQTFVENINFPLMVEYRNVKRYHDELLKRKKRKQSRNKLFHKL